MTHIYNNTFFDYIDQGAQRSARSLIAKMGPILQPQSVLDLGCGRGVWLNEWARSGARTVAGVDGDYVDRKQLTIPQKSFIAADLTRPIETGRRFDLAQSLEVGEHLPGSASDTLIDSLTNASDRVLFSAAVIGQGGEFHINERPLSFWQGLFEERGYHAIDCVRPKLKNATGVEPWYRFNTVLYVNEAGRKGLPDDVLRHSVPYGQKLANGGNALWKLRRAVVTHLPQNAVTRIAQARAWLIATRASRSAKEANAVS
ncbi:class I SAM-dependent methyltransferase [Primorskyibacter sp. 2E107]|uniref:class I SAM-dependent methyltransferase n=1 Tax=Primorskyibacter sp. 2E107 TaxID=3403458 RepID=UPI003AF5D57B